MARWPEGSSPAPAAGAGRELVRTGLEDGRTGLEDGRAERRAARRVSRGADVGIRAVAVSHP